MPFGWIDPEVFLTHGDVTIYHVYKDDEIAQGRREYWYTTDLSGGDYEDPCSFDVRDLPTFTPKNLMSKSSLRPSNPESFHCLNHNHFSKVVNTWYPFRANAFAILCWQSDSAMVS